jgi:hypothetical protein
LVAQSCYAGIPLRWPYRQAVHIVGLCCFTKCSSIHGITSAYISPRHSNHYLLASIAHGRPGSGRSPSFHTLQVQPPTSLLPPRAPAQRLRCQRSLAPSILPGESRPSRDAFRLGLTIALPSDYHRRSVTALRPPDATASLRQAIQEKCVWLNKYAFQSCFSSCSSSPLTSLSSGLSV